MTKTVCFDLDGVICSNTNGEYEKALAFFPSVYAVNELYSLGYRILIFTARGSTTGKDWRELTEKQLSAWGVKYHELKFGKPEADLYVDDRAFEVPFMVGAGSFPLEKLKKRIGLP